MTLLFLAVHLVISIVLLHNKLFKKTNKKLFNITYFGAKDPEHKDRVTQAKTGRRVK